MIIQTEEKPKRRVPPPPVKADSFIGIQLKPVSKDPKAANKAKLESNLKVKNNADFCRLPLM